MENDIYSHYFDWAATAPANSEILTEALAISLQETGNPSSLHELGKNAKAKLTEARIRCAKATGVKPETLYFTSGGTEGDYLPILSLLSRPVRGTILISAIEHPAIREQALMMKNCGFSVQTVMPNSSGIITPEAVADKLTNDTLLVCVMAVNNETGAIQPIYDIADIITEKTKGHRRPKFHVDSVQAAGKIPLELSYSGIDSASISAHKLGGPRGIGLMYMAQIQEPFIRGGGQENGIRSGTENLFGAWALSRCLENYYLRNDTANNPTEQLSNKQRYNEQIQLTSDFLSKLHSIKNCKIVPEDRNDTDCRFSPWIIQAAFLGIPGEVMTRALNEKGFYISTGSACSARKQKRPILEAMNAKSEIVSSAVRLSFGTGTTRNGMEGLFNAIKEVCKDFNR